MSYNLGNDARRRLLAVAVILKLHDNKASRNRTLAGLFRNENVIGNLLVVRDYEAVTVGSLIHTDKCGYASVKNADNSRLALHIPCITSLGNLDKHLIIMKCIQRILKRYKEVIRISLNAYETEASSGAEESSHQHIVRRKHISVILCLYDADLVFHISKKLEELIIVFIIYFKKVL